MARNSVGKLLLALSLGALGLAGCGLASPMPGTASGYLGMMDTTPLMQLPGIPVGAPMALTGKYQNKYDLTGQATITALDANHLAIDATITAHWLFVSETKHVTVSVTTTQDAQWPYFFDTENLTDGQSFKNKAVLTSGQPGNYTFQLDDGSTSVFSADGQGHGQIVSKDFSLSVTANQQLLPILRDPNAPTLPIFRFQPQ